MELPEHFFRRESARMVAALVRIFGVHNLALAEDVVQDAFGRALTTWPLRGLPDNPSAWLMTTAKNRALDVVRRERRARAFAPEMGRLLETEWTLAPLVEEAFTDGTIRDEQLRMMFSCCHPRVAEEAQLPLVLHLLCGFGAEEIAAALLCGRSAIEKRISRGKKALAGAKTLFDLGDRDFAARLSTVQRALYLLFSEGYHGAATSPVQVDLCMEAIRLVGCLLAHPPSAVPSTHALAALMCLHAARLPAKVDAVGDLSALSDQDRSRWDRRLLGEGLLAFERSAVGDQVSAFHLEAAIAAVHAGAPSLAETDWALIVSLYDRLVQLDSSPVIALARAIALGQRDGAAAGLEALAAIDGERLASYPFFPAARGEMELARGARGEAHDHFSAALALARSDAERRFLERRLHACAARGPSG